MERASRVSVPLMVFPLVDVPKVSLLQCEFLEDMRPGTLNGDEDEDHVELYSQRVMLYR